MYMGRYAVASRELWDFGTGQGRGSHRSAGGERRGTSFCPSSLGLWRGFLL